MRCLHEGEECVLEVQSENRSVLVFWAVTHVLVDHLARCLEACDREVDDEPFLYGDATVDLTLPQDKEYGESIAVETALVFPKALLSLSLQLIVLDMVILVVLLSDAHHILEVPRGGWDLILRTLVLLETLDGGLCGSLDCRCPEIMKLLQILFWSLILTQIIGLFIILLMSPVFNQLNIPLIMSFGRLGERIREAISANHSFLMSSTEPVHYTFLMVRGSTCSS